MVFGQGLEFDLPKGVVRGVNELREWQIALRGSHPQLAGAPLAGAAASQPMDRLRRSPTVRNGALSCQQALVTRTPPLLRACGRRSAPIASEATPTDR